MKNRTKALVILFAAIVSPAAFGHAGHETSAMASAAVNGMWFMAGVVLTLLVMKVRPMAAPKRIDD